MENCDKYRKKFFIGMILFLGGMIFAYFGKSLNVYDLIAILIIFGLGIAGMAKKMLPYYRCLSQFTRSIK